jgi:hypothetical protein
VNKIIGEIIAYAPGILLILTDNQQATQKKKEQNAINNGSAVFENG